jgi:pentatricopeptide repeat protein
MGYVDRAFHTLKRMIDASCEPDYRSYCILLKHLLRGDLNSLYVDASGLWNLMELDTVWQFLEKMSEHGLNPTITTYSSLIAGFCKASRSKEACILLDYMCGKDITPNEEIYTLLIKCCCDTKFFEKASSFVNNMIECGFQPHLDSYQHLILGLCNEGEFEKAKSLFSDLLELGYNHDEVAWKILIDGLLKVGYVDICSQMLSTMENTHCCISSQTYAMVTNGMHEASGSLVGELQGKAT